MSDGFNGADLRNVCTEAGLFAIRDERDFVNQDSGFYILNYCGFSALSQFIEKVQVNLIESVYSYISTLYGPAECVLEVEISP